MTPEPGPVVPAAVSAVVKEATTALESCPICGSVRLLALRCKVICQGCRTILQSCADL